MAAEVFIPTGVLEQELLKAAASGMFGQLRIEIDFQPLITEQICLRIVRNLTAQPGKKSYTRPVQGSEIREDKVKRAIEEFRPRLRVRCDIGAVVAHFADGVLLKYEVLERDAKPVADRL